MMGELTTDYGKRLQNDFSLTYKDRICYMTIMHLHALRMPKAAESWGGLDAIKKDLDYFLTPWCYDMKSHF